MSVENQLVVVGPGGTCSPGGTLLFVVFNDVFPLSISFVRFSTFLHEFALFCNKDNDNIFWY